jgi:hypothetical protein
VNHGVISGQKCTATPVLFLNVSHHGSHSKEKARGRIAAMQSHEGSPVRQVLKGHIAHTVWKVQPRLRSDSSDSST